MNTKVRVFQSLAESERMNLAIEGKNAHHWQYVDIDITPEFAKELQKKEILQLHQSDKLFVALGCFSILYDFETLSYCSGYEYYCANDFEIEEIKETNRQPRDIFVSSRNLTVEKLITTEDELKNFLQLPKLNEEKIKKECEIKRAILTEEWERRRKIEEEEEQRQKEEKRKRVIAEILALYDEGKIYLHKNGKFAKFE